MAFLLRNYKSSSPSLEQTTAGIDQSSNEDYPIEQAFQLLDLYLDTDESAPLYPLLQQVRDQLIEDLDAVDSVKEIYGLMYWLMADQNVENRGESLEETADRLGDLDIEQGTDQYTDLIFHLKDAVERLYDLELE